MNIQLIKTQGDVPTKLPVNGIVMNGTEQELSLNEEITSFEGTITSPTLSGLASFAKNCSCLGALLSYDSNTGVYTIWNGDKDAADYWDPQSSDVTTPSDQYGDVIGVCARHGNWVSVKWWGLKRDSVSITVQGDSRTVALGDMYWAYDDDYYDEHGIYLTMFAKLVYGTGWENTKYLFDNYGSEIIKDVRPLIEAGNEYNTWVEVCPTLWGALTKSNIPGIKDWLLNSSGQVTQIGDQYIPSTGELTDIWANCMDNNELDMYDDCPGYDWDNNIGLLLQLNNSETWASSQCIDDCSGAIDVYDWGNAENCSKSTERCSIACIHF